MGKLQSGDLLRRKDNHQDEVQVIVARADRVFVTPVRVYFDSVAYRWVTEKTGKPIQFIFTDEWEMASHKYA